MILLFRNGGGKGLYFAAGTHTLFMPLNLR